MFKDAPVLGEGLTSEQIATMTPEEKTEWREKEKKRNDELKKTKKNLQVKGVNQEQRFFKGIEITNKGEVIINMSEKVMMGTNNETGKEIWRSIPYSVGPIPYAPHKDLKKAMKDLTTHALALYGFPDASIKDTTVSGVQVSGEIENRNARVLLTISRDLDWSKKPVKTKLPQLTLFDQILYDKNPKLIELLEVLVKEVWLYIGGKHEHKEHLSLFND